MLKSMGAVDHDLVVLRTEDLSSRFRRIWLRSETLLDVGYELGHAPEPSPAAPEVPGAAPTSA